MNYQEAENWLDARQMFTVKLGLESIRELLAAFGNPQKRLKILHIAGSNGKGSVGATLLSIFTAAGIYAGFYSSPHLSSVRERFRLDDQYISRAEFAALITKLADFFATSGRPLPTYFECTTLLALLWFAEQGAEAVILETGMGGRLDATNVVTPLVSIISDISVDHEQYLGTTLAEIAGEKAGIIKPGVPVVFSGHAAEIVPLIEARCQQQGSPLFLYGREFYGARAADGGLEYRPITGAVRLLHLGLRGEHQIINTSLALAALDVLSQEYSISPQDLEQGVLQVRWPGRMELIPILHGQAPLCFLLDGAHNEAGVAALVQTLRQGVPRRRLFLLWGMMADKQMGAAWSDLLAMSDGIVLTQVQSLRSAAPSAIWDQMPPALQSRAQIAETVELALEAVQAMASSEDLICVAGSIYLVGKVRQLLVGELAQ